MSEAAPDPTDEPDPTELLARFISGEGIAELARSNGLDRARLLALVTEGALDRTTAAAAVARGEEIRRDAAAAPKRPRRSRRAYTEAEVLACLREAQSDVDGPLTTMSYNRVALERTLPDGDPWPPATTIARQFGTWREAVRTVADHLRSPPP